MGCSARPAVHRFLRRLLVLGLASVAVALARAAAFHWVDRHSQPPPAPGR